MLNGKRVVAVIPARGGSKGVPFKNVRPLGGRPLIAWSIDVAKQTSEIDRVLVSTDDPKIADVSRSYGAEVKMRPAHLAQDQSRVIDTVRHLIAELKAEGESAEYMVLLEPTTPLRAVTDVGDCVRDLGMRGLDSVATFMEARLNPGRAWKIQGAVPEPFLPGVNPWLPRQELTPAYQMNGAVFAFRMGGVQTCSDSLLFGRCGAVLMPYERSVDIDHEHDFLIAEAMIKSRHPEAR